MNFITKIRMILSVVLAVLVMKIAKELMILAKLVGMAILVINVNALLETFAKTKKPTKVSQELVTRDFYNPKVLQGTDAEKVEYFIELRSNPEKVNYGVVVKTSNPNPNTKFFPASPRKKGFKKIQSKKWKRVNWGVGSLWSRDDTSMIPQTGSLSIPCAEVVDNEPVDYDPLFPDSDYDDDTASMIPQTGSRKTRSEIVKPKKVKKPTDTSSDSE